MIFDEIKSVIDSSDSIVLLPHLNADGDATGSCFALAHALRKIGKSVDVVFEEYPRMREVVDGEYKLICDAKTYDAAFAIDSGDMSRLGNRGHLFLGRTVCIDHHHTNGTIAEVNCIETESSATGELIYLLIESIDPSLFDTYIAECLYMAISADTGCFKYSNTTPRTHRIAASLLEIGGDFTRINKAVFETVSLGKIKAQADAVLSLELLHNDRIAFYALSYDKFHEKGYTSGDIDYISSMLKNISGVDAGVFLHERDRGMWKVSLRTNEGFDAASLSKMYGGGGHACAAGFSLQGDFGFVKETVISALEKLLGD